MRTDDLKAGTKYGTCDGKMVVPISPVHARYAQVKAEEDEEVKIVELDEDSLKGKRSDPWSKCTPHWSQRANIGVKVTVHSTFDRDGEEVDEGVISVIKPDDIAGTWKDYLVLHGETVRRAYDEREAEKVRVEMAEMMESYLLDMTGVDFEVSVSSFRGVHIEIERKRLTVDEARAVLPTNDW